MLQSEETLGMTRTARIFLRLPGPSQNQGHSRSNQLPDNPWSPEGIHGLAHLSTLEKVSRQRNMPLKRLLVQEGNTQSGELLIWCHPLLFLDK